MHDDQDLRRGSRRLVDRARAQVQLSIGPSIVDGRLVDVSESGAGVEVSGHDSDALHAGELLHLKSGDQLVPARVVRISISGAEAALVGLAWTSGAQDVEALRGVLADRRVFISHAYADRDIAQRIARTLSGLGRRVWIDRWELSPTDTIASRIERAVASSDFMLVVLSPRSVDLPWVQNELSAALARELKDRAITVIPTLVEDCEVPPLLADKQYVDLRHNFDVGLQSLASQLAVAPDITFSELDPRSFERLVADLLTVLGFSVQSTRLARDTGFDFVASYRASDPFGAEKTETWLIEAKFYQEQRVSVSALRQMLGYLMTSPTAGKGLVVTNSRMTSVARDFLAEITRRYGQDLRVVDGSELARLVSQHPELVSRYFPRSSSQ